MIISLNIQSKGNLLVKSGEKIDFNTPFFKRKLQKQIKLPIAQRLNTSPKKIFSYLKKFIGDEVKKGEIIAQKKTLFTKLSYYSDYDGRIKEINHDEGYLLLDIFLDEEDVIRSYFKGEIESVDKNILKLKVNHLKEFELKTTNGDFGGEIFFLDSSTIIAVEKTRNKIILAKKFSSYDQIKLEALDVNGFISLHQLPEKTENFYAILKNSQDWQKIIDLNFPCCIIDNKNNKIYFYK